MQDSAEERFDDASAEAYVTVIEYHRLSRCYGTLRLGEFHAVTVTAGAKRAGLIGLAIARLGAAAQRQGWRFTGHPMQIAGDQPAAVEAGMIMALGHYQDVARQVLVHYVPWQFRCVPAAAYANALALA